MIFPFVVIDALSKEQIEKWRLHYEAYTSKYTDRDRKIDEGMWIRNQMFFTRKASGWKNRNDMRRKLVYYVHSYNIIEVNKKKCLVMDSSYLWIHYSFPENEVEEYLQSLFLNFKSGNWEKIDATHDTWLFMRGDLFFEVRLKSSEEEDVKVGMAFPINYKYIEITIFTENIRKNVWKKKQKAWARFHYGPRKRDKSGDYEVIMDVNELKPYFPAHVELGCGPSIELGIPPLNFLHGVYYVTDKDTDKYILDLQKDNLAVLVAENPEQSYSIFSMMFKSCFLAKPTSEFYKILKVLHDKNQILDPVFTNNFDGVPLLLGIDEYYLRRYETENLKPNVKFNPLAKSLISIGSHADRRRIQQAAREQGLKVIHIDPEGYYKDNTFHSYPLEAIMDGDLIYRADSSKAFTEIYNSFGNI